MWKRSPRCSTDAWALLALCCVGMSGVAAAAPPEALAEIADRILDEGKYQTELPSGIEAIVLPPGLGSFATLLLYVLIAIGVILLAFWLANEFAGERSSLSGRDAGGLPASEESGDGRVRLADPDRLAAEGRYEEAVHVLLLLAIRRLVRLLPEPPGPSATSRELLRTLPLPPETREAFGELVRQVELSLFGGRPTDATHYARCRRRFRTLEPEAAG